MSKNELTSNENEIIPIVEKSIKNVREEMFENAYIEEAIKVLRVGGYRSAIGSFWNAVIDDLRNKVMHRSLPLFNTSVNPKQEIKSYEDFQNHITDDVLIDGAYKIGVIGWEASKILKHAKETRHIFDGHPRSSEPSIFKVLGMMDDCVKYVLKEEYPPMIINIDDYISNMGDSSFDRNKIAIEIALGDLPEIYKKELINRLFSAYVCEASSTTLKSNIEFVAPILWQYLPKKIKVQIVRRVDQETAKGNKNVIILSFEFVELVEGTRYLSVVARGYKTAPFINKLFDNLDQWNIENHCVKQLKPYAPYIPDNLLEKFVTAITLTYIGREGTSNRFPRTDFYADEAADIIPEIFSTFDDRAAKYFIHTILTSEILQRRIKSPIKLRRLRTLGIIVHEKVSGKFAELNILELIIDETKEKEFFQEISK